MAWTGPQEDLLRELARQGLSGGQIAERLGKTRSAVCGKAWRFGLCLGGFPAHGGTAIMRVRRKRAATKRTHKPKPKVKPFVLFHQMGLVDINAPKRERSDGFVPQVFPPAPEHQRKTVETLEDISCRWPIGDPLHADFHFCGAEKVPGLPYCSEHSAIAYQPIKLRAPMHHSTPVPAFQTEDA
jgi:GcrA cell cycle regulator